MWDGEMNRTFLKANIQILPHPQGLCITFFYQGGANQNIREISSHTSETGTHQKEHKQPMLARMWGKRSPHSC